MKRFTLIPVFVLGAYLGGASADEAGQWERIFNGKNLEGWTVKIGGFPAGENHKNTFVAEDGMLRVKYDNYKTFSNEYGHIFYHKKLSHYRLRLEYRFQGEKVPGSKHFTELNSGVMLHAQSAHSMSVNQAFPVSVEAQFLACKDLATCDRTTMNVASPGTHIVTEQGELRTSHMTWTKEKARMHNEWVSVEVEVRGSESIVHKVDGKVVMRYRQPQIGGSKLPNNYPLTVGTILKDGYIALQGESHPVDFRNIELMTLPKR